MDRVSCRTLAIVLENAGIPDPALDLALSDLPGVAAWLRDREAFLPSAICVEVLARLAPLVDDPEELRRRERLESLPEAERLTLEGVLEAFAERCSSARGGAVVDLFIARARIAKQAEWLETLGAIGATAAKHVDLGELAEALIDLLRHRLHAAGIALRVSARESGSRELRRRVGDCPGPPTEAHELHTASRRVGRIEFWSGPAGFGGPADLGIPELIPWIALVLDNARLVTALRDRGARLEFEVSQRRELEHQLRQAQKMDALGSLAGGIAHNFNNLLTIIAGYGEILLEQQREGAPAASDEIEEILAAVGRAAGLTTELLAFSRQQVLQPTVVDASDLVLEVARMLQPLIGEDIELVTITGEEPARIRADPGQIQQVLLNLAVNARDAMPSGGTLTLEVSSTRLDEAQARAAGEWVAGSEVVVLSVSDTGCGMSEEVRRLVFDPFFTTKETGKGTGLGLSTAYGIVRQSQGQIAVESELGRGATFRIYLPRAVGEEERPAARRSDFLTAGGSETLLVVEDSDGLRDLQRKILEARGYRVLAARSGEEALRRAAAHSGPIPLLIADVVMPQMSGPELAERLIPERPEMHVLYVSGYSESSIAERGEHRERLHFLSKPFTPEELARRVREVLDRGRLHRMLKARPASEGQRGERES